MSNDKTVCGNHVAAVFVAGAALLVWAASAQAALTTYWDFNETSGAVLNDVIGSSDGTLQEGFAPGFGPTHVAGRAGAGNALNFNPDNGDPGFIIDSVSITPNPIDALDFGTGALTFTGWFRATGLPLEGLNQNAVFFNDSVHGFGGITAQLFRINTPIPSGNTGKLIIDIKGTGGDNIFVRSNVPLNDGNWHWYAMVAQGGAGGLVNLYVDGLLQNISATYGAGTTASPVDNVFIGSRNPNSNYFVGDLDDMAFFDTALTGTLDQVGNLTGGDLFTLWQNGPLAVGADLVGDLDGDGFVGIADLNIVLGAWNQNVPPANPLADPSGDGFVGIEDLNTVLGNWNAGTPPPSNTAVPEPATALLVGVGGLMMSRRRTA